LGVELSYQFREPPVGKLSARRLQGFPQPLAVVETIHMERAVAPVAANFSTAGSAESADPEGAPECAEVAFCLHAVTLLQDQPNQWISC
jgi:hypothetical protein